MASLVNRVRAISNSTTAISSPTEVVSFIRNSARYVISHIPKSFLRPYSSEGTVSSSTGFAYSDDVVIGVRRGSYPSEEVDASVAVWLEADSGSFLVPTAQFPKHYYRAGSLFIKPNPSTAAVGYIDRIAVPTINTASTGVLGNMEPIILNMAAGYDLMGLGSYWSNKASSEIASSSSAIGTLLASFETSLPDDWDYTITATEIEDALTKAKNLIDNQGSVDFEDWLTAEDSEMARSAVEGASQEVSRAIREIEKIKLYIENESAERQTQLAKAKMYIDAASIRAQEMNTTVSHIQNAQSYFRQATELVKLSMTQIDHYIKNSESLYQQSFKPERDRR